MKSSDRTRPLRLRLRRATVRELSARQLDAVAGGRPPDSNDNNHCSVTNIPSIPPNVC